jgi:hypothetical protein
VSLIVKLLEKFFSPAKGKKATISVSIFYQHVAFIAIIFPIVLIEDNSLLFIIYLSLQTNYEPLIKSLIKYGTVFYEDRFELDDSFMDTSSG